MTDVYDYTTGVYRTAAHDVIWVWFSEFFAWQNKYKVYWELLPASIDMQLKMSGGMADELCVSTGLEELCPFSLPPLP